MSLRRSLPILVALAVIALTTLAQNPLTTYPNNYKVALDNADVSIVRVHYGPHETLGAHDHSKFPTVYVYLSDAGPVRFSHDEIPPFVITRPAVIKGSFRVSPGRIERHTVENLGEQSSDFLRIELKRLPLKNTLHPVRGNAPAKLQSGSVEEFSSTELTIHRIVCNPGQACPINASSLPTLLVALSSLKVVTSESTHAEKQMQSGDIQWLPSAGDLSVTASGPDPAHLLAVELHQTAR